MDILKQSWRKHPLFGRIVGVSLVVLAALLLYLGSRIPRAVSLPDDDLNAKCTARIRDEQIVIQKPSIAPGDLVLSYVGSKNEVADMWLQNATLDQTSQRLLFPNSATPVPARISYTTGNAPANASDCRTTIEVRRANGSAPVDALKLYQTDDTAGAQRFRQVVLDAGRSTLEIEVHTDSSSTGAMGMPACPKLLTVGNANPIELPSIPVHMLVKGGAIDLHFNPANPELPIWTGPDQTFEAVSLGDGTLRGAALQVIATQHSIAPRLDVRASRSGDTVTFSQLKLGSEMLKLDTGRDAEAAKAYASGSSLYSYDLIAAIQKNPVLATELTAALGLFSTWINMIWSRKRKAGKTKSAQPAADKPVEP